MRGNLPVYAGVIGGIAFSAGWLAMPNPTAVVAFSLVTGTTAALSQISTRELLAKCQTQVDKGLDSLFADGGENLVASRDMRDRVERLSWNPIICGVIASGAAALGTSYKQAFWPALAFCAATIALLVGAKLFTLNRHLARFLEDQRLANFAEKRAQDFITKSKPLDPKAFADDPNILGYGIVVPKITKQE